MKRTLRTLDFYSIIIGALFLVQGIFNIVNPPFLGLFTSSLLHAIIHILLGIFGIWSGLMGGAYRFSVFLGIFLLSVGVLYFLPLGRGVIVELLNVSFPVAWLNILFGSVSLMVAFISRKLGDKFSVQ